MLAIDATDRISHERDKCLVIGHRNTGFVTMEMTDKG
jgi:hypothetical protein